MSISCFKSLQLKLHNVMLYLQKYLPSPAPPCSFPPCGDVGWRWLTGPVRHRLGCLCWGW